MDAVLGSWDTSSKNKHLQFNKFFFNLLKNNSYSVIPLIPSLGYILGYISVFVVFGSEHKVDMPKLIQQDSWAVRLAKQLSSLDNISCRYYLCEFGGGPRDVRNE